LRKARSRGGPSSRRCSGTWPFAASTLSESDDANHRSRARILARLRHPYFAVSLVPNHAATGSYGGTAVYRAFAMHSADDARVPGENIETLIGHEYLHTWIPRSFRKHGRRRRGAASLLVLGGLHRLLHAHGFACAPTLRPSTHMPRSRTSASAAT
jgi:hypothetical protein